MSQKWLKNGSYILVEDRSNYGCFTFIVWNYVKYANMEGYHRNMQLHIDVIFPARRVNITHTETPVY